MGSLLGEPVKDWGLELGILEEEEVVGDLRDHRSWWLLVPPHFPPYLLFSLIYRSSHFLCSHPWSASRLHVLIALYQDSLEFLNSGLIWNRSMDHEFHTRATSLVISVLAKFQYNNKSF